MNQDPIQQMPPPLPKDTFEENTISFMDMLLVLVRHLKLIIILPSIFCTIAIIYTSYSNSPEYISKATFMSSGSSSSERSQMSGLAAQFGFSYPSSHIPQWVYTDVLASRTFAKNLLYRKFDTKEYGPRKSLLQILTYGYTEPTGRMDTLIKNGINAVQGMIDIKISGRMYKLKVTSFEAQLAADVANAVMEELDRHQREYNAKKATETREFIEKRLVETKKELEQAEEAMKEFRERNRSILESPQLQMEQERLARSVSVLISVFTTIKQELETAKINEVKESDYVIILDEPEIPLFPVPSKRRLMVIVAGCLGIGLGMVLAFIREYARNSDEEEQEKMKKAKSLIVQNLLSFLPSPFKK